MFLRRLIAVLIFALAPSLALAQGAIQQVGPATTGHALMWYRNGQAMDAGGPPGNNLAPVNNVNPGTMPLGYAWVNSGLGDCGFSAYASAMYSSLCRGFDDSGNAIETFNGFTLWSATNNASAPGMNLLGTPTSTTPPPADNSTKIATTAFVDTAIAGIMPVSGTAQVASNALLAAASTATYPNGVIRLGIVAGDNTPWQFFSTSANPCTLHAGAGDVGTQVPSSNGKCWIAGSQSVIDFREFGPDPSGTLDMSAKYNDFLAAVENLANGSTRRGFIPQGVYRFTQQPNCVSVPVQIFGATDGATQLDRDYNGSGTTGLMCAISGSSTSLFKNIIVNSRVAHTGGSLMSIITTDVAGNIGLMTLENIKLTTDGSCTNDYGLYVDGSFTTSGAKGVRNLNMKNVHAFGAAISSVSFIGVVGVTWHGGSQEEAGCNTPSNAGIRIDGTTDVPSTNIVISIESALDGIALSHVSNVNITLASLGDNGGVSVDDDSSVSYARVDASFSTGTATHNGTHIVYSLGGLAQTWSPTLVGESTAGNITYTGGTTGNYSFDSSGQNYTATFIIGITSVSVAPTGLIDIGGLPFMPVRGDGGCTFSYIKVVTYGSGYTWLSGLMTAGTNTMRFYENGSNNSPHTLSASAVANTADTLLIDNTTEIHGTCTGSIRS